MYDVQTVCRKNEFPTGDEKSELFLTEIRVWDENFSFWYQKYQRYHVDCCYSISVNTSSTHIFDST